MENIVELCGRSNAPGLKRIKLVDVREVVSIAKPRLHKIAGVKTWTVLASGIKLLPTATIVSIDFMAGLATMAENMMENEGAFLFDNVIETSVKIDNPDCAMAISLLIGKGLIGFTQDRNGFYKILGDLKQPLRLRNSVVSIGANERTLGFGATMRHQAYFVETILNEALLEGRADAFSGGFSFGFN
jgi:hypothetical protein